MNILGEFLGNAARLGARAAIIEGTGRVISYSDIARRSAAVAVGWSQRGIQSGDRVLIAMPLGIDLYVGLAALWRLGATAVFPEPAMGLAGLRHAARATAPKAFLHGGWFGALRFVVPELWRIGTLISVTDDATRDDPIADLTATAPALISFTSGSTGVPKAIVRSHGFLAAQNSEVGKLLQPTRDQEIDLVAFPVFVIANLSMGATSVLPRWNLKHHDRVSGGELRTQMRQRSITRALVPPSICETLAAENLALPLGAIMTGGGPVFPDVVERLQTISPATNLTAVYGSTEAEPIAHLDASEIGASDWQTMKAGGGLLAGRPISAIRLMLRDDEIIVTGDHVNKGYLDAAQDGSTKLMCDNAIWHRTGDAGRIDAQGKLWLLGRLDGRAADHYPFSIETATRFWPGVRRSALINIDSHAILAIEGDPSQQKTWRERADVLGGIEVKLLAKIPLDRRHRSKVDYVALRGLIA